MDHRITTVIAAFLLIGATFVPTAGAQQEVDEVLEQVDVPSEIDVSLGDAHYEDFQADDGGYEASDVPDRELDRPAPDNPQWEWGQPTSGPGEAASGDNVWATNLDGNYAESCAGLASPTIDLTDADSAEVSFQHWIETDDGFGYSLYDAGVIMVTADGGETFDYIVPEEGYDNDLPYSAEDCLDGTPNEEKGFGGDAGVDYRQGTVNLDEYVGEEIQIVFAFATTGDADSWDGWYLDDFTTTIDGVSTVEDFETDDGGFEIVSTELPDHIPPFGWEWGHPEYGPSVAEDENLWGVNLEGDHGHGECAWVESTTIDLTTPEATAANHATLSWEQYFRAWGDDGGGVVQIGVDGEYTNIVPDEGEDDLYGSPHSDLDDCLEHETQGTGGFTDFISGPSDGMSSYSADISDYLGEEITVRYVFATTEDTGRTDGWYVDDVAVSMSFYQDLPDVEPADGAPGVEHPGWNGSGDWEWGPVETEDGPTGSVAYGTNLNADYNDDACHVLETSVDVPVSSGNLSWDQWLRSSSFSSGGTLQVVDDEGAHVVVPEEGYVNDPWSLDTDECTLHESQDTGVMAGFEQSSEDPMETFHADLSDWAGEQVTLRFAFGVEDSYSTYPGWYVNNVTLDGVPLMSDSPDTTPVLDLIPDEDPQQVVEDVNDTVNRLAGQAQAQPDQYTGWTVGGEHISWAHDEATTGPEGENVTATNPHGVHSEDEQECSYVQSPTVPTELIGENLELSFDHHTDMSYYDGWFSSGARTAGLILVSTDGGASWEILETEANDKEIYYTGIYDCFEQLGVQPDGDDNRAPVDEAGVIGGETDGMETVTADLSEYADASSITVRYAFGTGTTVYAQNGWYFNNVDLGDVELMP